MTKLDLAWAANGEINLERGENKMFEEKDPTGKAAKEPGSKLDAGKSPVFRGLLQYFPRACRAVANVSLFGANKYTWKGWEKVPDGPNRYGDALARHIVDEQIDGPIDPTTGLMHAAQQAWNALARLELMLQEQERTVLSHTGTNAT